MRQFYPGSFALALCASFMAPYCGSVFAYGERLSRITDSPESRLRTTNLVSRQISIFMLFQVSEHLPTHVGAWRHLRLRKAF